MIQSFSETKQEKLKEICIDSLRLEQAMQNLILYQAGIIRFKKTG
jgi:hypothetical protein